MDIDELKEILKKRVSNMKDAEISEWEHGYKKGIIYVMRLLDSYSDNGAIYREAKRTIEYDQEIN